MIFDTELESELLTQDHRNMLVQHGQKTPLREGMHASAVLDKHFCLREQVLHQLYPEQAEKEPWGPWDWKKSAIYENGWMFHRRIQQLHARFGNVVWTPVTYEQIEAIIFHVPPALHNFYVRCVDGRWEAAELDLTHYDAERNLFFSPDMITLFGGERYIWELKGINQDAFAGNIRYDADGNQLVLYSAAGKKIVIQEGITDELEQACQANETVHKAREQVNLYMHLLGQRKGIVLVENKSNQDFKLYVTEYEQERVYPYIERIYDVKGQTALARMNGELPLRCCKSASESRAKSCPMRTVCFKQQESEDW
jgi:hypothetical protein